MAKTTEPKDSRILAEVSGKIYAGIVSVFICVILAVFPLYYQDYYFDILRAKYKFYWISVIALLAVTLVVSLVFCFVDFMEYEGKNTKAFLHKFSLGSLKKVPMEYKMLVLFWLFSAISTIQSDYVYESFWGNEGRYSGLFLLTLYALGTVLVAKFGRMKRWYLDLFLLVSLFVCLFGITDYFRMDILGWKVNVKPEQGDIFTSTLGNVNTYTAYVAIVLGICCSLFVKEKNIFQSLWYYVLSAVGFFAILTGQSDNAYLALGILFVALPFFVYKEKKGIVRYAVLAATLVTVIKLVYVISEKMVDRVVGFSGIIRVIGGHSLMMAVIGLLWCIAIGLFVWARRQESAESGKVGQYLRRAWITLIAALAAAVLFVLFDANFGGHPERYEALSDYVIFSDTWGTNRGYCWRIAWQCYQEQPLMHKLFGYGPDTFGILTWDYREEAIQRYNIYFESAHNEYLQYLVTIGPFALAAYLGFIGSSLKRMVQTVKEQPWTLAFFMAPLCYCVQAVVNINLPIATPIMWLFLAMGLAACREMTEAEGEIQGQTAENSEGNVL